MQNLNYFFGTALGVYLIAVVYHGNHDKFISVIAEQKDFAKWLTAIMVLMLIEKQTKSGLVSSFVYIAIVAMLLSASGELAIFGEQIKTVFATGTGSETAVDKIGDQINDFLKIN